jgi:hypothetical protein
MSNSWFGRAQSIASAMIAAGAVPMISSLEAMAPNNESQGLRCGNAAHHDRALTKQSSSAVGDAV